MSYELLVLRFVHVIGGAFWFGAAFASILWFGPAIGAAGPAAAAEIGAVLHRRKMLLVMPIVALLTILSGIRLIWIVSGGFGHEYFKTAMGHTYAVAGSLGLLAFVIGIFIARPRMMKGKPGAMYLANVLLGLCMVGMALARYLH